MELNEYIQLRLVHEVHTSEAKSYRGCRRRWNWIFNDGWYPLTTAKPLEFGVAFHKALEVAYDPDKWNWPTEVRLELAKQAFRDKCASQLAAYAKHFEVWEDVQQDYDERVELGMGMLDYYFAQVAPEGDEGWKPEAVEVEFMVPIRDPDTGEFMWCKCDRCWKQWSKHKAETMERYTPADLEVWRSYSWQGLPVVWAGRLDVLAKDARGDYWIIDWKTAAQLRDDWFFLELDDQVGSYVLAMYLLGLPVRGFVYHAQRKGYPEPPAELSRPYRGCKFSVSQNQNTDYETFLTTVQMFDTEAYMLGLYDDFLMFLQLDGIKYFDRREIHKTPNQLASMERNLGLQVKEMLNKPAIYPAPGRFGCNTCAFQGPCVEMDRGGDYQYMLETLFEKREPYYLRDESSTESKGGM